MIRRITGFIAVFARFGKFSISLPVALTTFTGYLLSHGSFTRGIIFPVIGVFLLAAAASALNQLQERRTDLIMPRTRNRPIPSGLIGIPGAWSFIILFALSGLALLYLQSGTTAALLGILTFFWYNGVYTPLKRKTAFAAVPGGIVGALPPLIGWAAAGGSLSSPTAIALGFFFFIGQIPHFWLLLLRYGHEYELAGLQSLTMKFTLTQIRRLTFIWIAATAVSAFMLPAFYPFDEPVIVYLLWIISLALVASFTGLLRPAQAVVKFRSSFIRINIYYFLVMVLLCIEAIN